MLDMYMDLVKVDETREGLLKALKDSISFDADISGKNGKEYTKKEAIAKGFDSTVDYIIDKVKEIEDNQELILTFYNMCFKHDGYYSVYNFKTLKNDSGNVIAITICAATNK